MSGVVRSEVQEKGRFSRKVLSVGSAFIRSCDLVKIEFGGDRLELGTVSSDTYAKKTVCF